MPVFWIDRMAVSRPDPGPLTSTSTRRTPCSIAARAAFSAANWAAKGVGLARALEPDVAGGRPRQRVALGVGDGDDGVVEGALDVRHPVGDVLRSFLRGRRPPGFGLATYFLTAFFLLATVFLGPLRSTSIRVGALPPHGEALAVAHALVGADLDLALDVLGDVAPQVTFDPEVLVDVHPDAIDLVVGQVPHTGVRVQAEVGAHLERRRSPDAEDVGERDLEPLLRGMSTPAIRAMWCLLSPGAACDGGWCR